MRGQSNKPLDIGGIIKLQGVRTCDVQAAEAQAVAGEAGPAEPEQTMDEKIAEAEKDFFDEVNRERKRLGRESKKLRVSYTIAMQLTAPDTTQLDDRIITLRGGNRRKPPKASSLLGPLWGHSVPSVTRCRCRCYRRRSRRRCGHRCAGGVRQ